MGKNNVIDYYCVHLLNNSQMNGSIIENYKLLKYPLTNIFTNRLSILYMYKMALTSIYIFRYLFPKKN